MNERPGESAHRAGEPGRPGRGSPTPPEPATWVLDRAALAELDRLCEHEFGLPGLALMENAAAGLARHTLDLLTRLGRRDAVVVCGPGNNAGDGLAAARHLHLAGCDVLLVHTGDPETLRGDAATNHRIVRAMGLPTLPLARWNPADEDRPSLLIDALFGTGLTRPVAGVYRDAVLRINRLSAHGTTVVAADLPSGLDADTGLVVRSDADEGVCVRADLTVTFAALKPGFGRLDAQRLLGEVVVAPIGCPAELLDRLGERVQPPRGHDSPGVRSGPAGTDTPEDAPAGRTAGDESAEGETTNG